jgi:hypothetical protein
MPKSTAKIHKRNVDEAIARFTEAVRQQCPEHEEEFSQAVELMLKKGVIGDGTVNNDSLPLLHSNLQNLAARVTGKHQSVFAISRVFPQRKKALKKKSRKAPGTRGTGQNIIGPQFGGACLAPEESRDDEIHEKIGPWVKAVKQYSPRNVDRFQQSVRIAAQPGHTEPIENIFARCAAKATGLAIWKFASWIVSPNGP